METTADRRQFQGLFLTLALVAALLLAACAEAPKPISTSGGVAIKGADPVAYFTAGKALKGKKKFEHSWKGVTWRFSNAKNRDLFKASPVTYAPQYGGNCAYNLTQRTVLPGDPNAWKIVNKKLYLLVNNRTKSKWEPSAGKHIMAADKFWSTVNIVHSFEMFGTSEVVE